MRTAALLLGFSILLWAQPKAEIDALAGAHLLKTRTPGIAIAIVEGGRVIYANGYGRASVELPDPVTADHLFRAGSTTKMFVALSVVRLAQRGVLKLDDPIGKVIPDLDPAIGKLTAHQILSHSAGLFDLTLMFGPHDDEALAANARSLTAESFFTKPGGVYSYSNIGFVLAGRLTEVAHRKPMADAVSELVFQPLGMARTTFRPTMAMTYPLSQGHVMENGAARVVRPVGDHAGYWPAGSMFTSARDMARMAIALMNEGKLDGNQALDPEEVRTMLTPRTPIPSPTADVFYGYGLQFRRFGLDRVVEHGGARIGYTTHLLMAPGRRIAIAVLTNSSGGQPEALAHELGKLLARLDGEKPAPPVSFSLDQIGGIYTHTGRIAKITVEGGKPVLHNGDRTLALEPSAGSCWKAADGGPAVCFTPGADGSIRYVTVGGRSFERK